MKRFLVVTSHATVYDRPGVELDAVIETAVAAEKQRLQAYLYSGNELVAVAHDVRPSGGDTVRIAQRAIVTVEGLHESDARTRADYQSGRLQSGSFGVEDFVQDEAAARLATGLLEVEAQPTLAEALEYAAGVLLSEEVEYALGLDSEHLSEDVTVTVDGVTRPYTEADLQRDLAKHRAIAELLRGAIARFTERPYSCDSHGCSVAVPGEEFDPERGLFLCPAHR